MGTGLSVWENNIRDLEAQSSTLASMPAHDWPFPTQLPDLSNHEPNLADPKAG